MKYKAKEEVEDFHQKFTEPIPDFKAPTFYNAQVIPDEISSLLSTMIQAISTEDSNLEFIFQSFINFIGDRKLPICNYLKNFHIKKNFKSILIECPIEPIVILCVCCMLSMCKSDPQTRKYFSTLSVCFKLLDCFDRYGTNILIPACDLLSHLVVGFDEDLFCLFDSIMKSYAEQPEILTPEQKSFLGLFYLNISKHVPSPYHTTLYTSLLTLLQMEEYTTTIQTIADLTQINLNSPFKESFYVSICVQREFKIYSKTTLKYENSILEEIMKNIERIPPDYLLYGLQIINNCFQVKLDFYHYLGAMLNLEFLFSLFTDYCDSQSIITNVCEIICSLLKVREIAIKIAQPSLISTFLKYLENAPFEIKKSSFISICNAVEFIPMEYINFMNENGFLDDLVCFFDVEDVDLLWKILHAVWVMVRKDESEQLKELIAGDYKDDFMELFEMHNERIDSYLKLLELQLFPEE